MMNFAESNGMHEMIQVQALDYVFRLWAEIFGHVDQRPALGESQDVAAPQNFNRQTTAAPQACGC